MRKTKKVLCLGVEREYVYFMLSTEAFEIYSNVNEEKWKRVERGKMTAIECNQNERLIIAYDSEFFGKQKVLIEDSTKEAIEILVKFI